MSSAHSDAILVVDDDAIVRRFVTVTLERHGYAVHQADSGDGGLKCFSEHRSRLAMVLSDVVMPGMTGPEMIERILAEEPGIRVMLMTGASAEAKLPRISPQVCHLLRKPFSSQSLLESVRNCLGRDVQPALKT